jgi:hypothetical protein
MRAAAFRDILTALLIASNYQCKAQCPCKLLMVVGEAMPNCWTNLGAMSNVANWVQGLCVCVKDRFFDPSDVPLCNVCQVALQAGHISFDVSPLVHQLRCI